MHSQNYCIIQRGNISASSLLHRMGKIEAYYPVLPEAYTHSSFTYTIDHAYFKCKFVQSVFLEVSWVLKHLNQNAFHVKQHQYVNHSHHALSSAENFRFEMEGAVFKWITWCWTHMQAFNIGMGAIGVCEKSPWLQYVITAPCTLKAYIKCQTFFPQGTWSQSLG